MRYGLLMMLAVLMTQAPSTLFAQSFIVAERGGFVSQVDAANNTRTVIANVPYADGIAFEDDNTVVVTAFAAQSSLTLVDINDGSQTAIACCFQVSQGVTLDVNGNALVAEQGAGRIVQVNLTHGAQATFIDSLASPSDILFEDANTVLISEIGTGSIVRVDLNTMTRTTLTSGLFTPIDLILDGAGNVLVAEWGAGQVTQVNLTTGAKSVLATVPQAHALQLDPLTGDLYILQYAQGQITKRAPDGTLSVVATGMVNPTFFVFGGCEAPALKEGKVMVAHQTNSQKNPCVALQVSQSALASHLAHGDYIITCIDDACAGSNKMSESQEILTTVQAIPNPFTDKVVFDFNSANEGQVNFDLFDISGKHLQQLPSYVLGKGQANMIQMNMHDLAPGTYIVRVSFENGVQKKIKLLKTE